MLKRDLDQKLRTLCRTEQEQALDEKYLFTDSQFQYEDKAEQRNTESYPPTLPLLA